MEVQFNMKLHTNLHIVMAKFVGYLQTVFSGMDPLLQRLYHRVQTTTQLPT